MGQVIQLDERRAPQSVAATSIEPSGATVELVSQETFANRLAQAALIRKTLNVLTQDDLLFAVFSSNNQNQILTLLPQQVASVSGDPREVGRALLKILEKAQIANAKVALAAYQDKNGDTSYTGVIRVVLAAEDMQKFSEYLCQHSKATAPQH